MTSGKQHSSKQWRGVVQRHAVVSTHTWFIEQRGFAESVTHAKHTESAIQAATRSAHLVAVQAMHSSEMRDGKSPPGGSLKQNVVHTS